MEAEDVSENPRISSLTKLMQALEACHTPADTLWTIQRGLQEAYGPFFGSMMLSTRGLPAGEYHLVNFRLENESPEYPDLWLHQEFPLHRGGVVAAIIKVRKPQILHDVDWTEDPYFHETLAESGSVMAIPFLSDRLPMTWMIFLKPNPVRFTAFDFEQVILQVALIGSLLESQTLADELARAKESIDREFRQMAKLQRSLLPMPLPRIPGLEIAASYEPTGQAGGDLYDFFPLDDDTGASGRWCVFIGDASGHGAAAAVVMAIIQAILHAHPREFGGPAGLLAHANHHLCQKNIGGFVTAFLAIYDPATQRLVYASAGHPPPLLKPSMGGRVRRLDVVASYPLGIDAANSFEEAPVELQQGDTLLLYTDGITEARAEDQTMFESERLEQEFQECVGRPDELIKHLLKSVKVHQREQIQVDDQTLVVARIV
jgi:sigma-B regulation protein RsbU (phosphoserine phosphatase)